MLDERIGLFSPTETLLPILSFIPEWYVATVEWCKIAASFAKDCFQINLHIIALANYSCGRYQMIEQRLNEVARALLREF
jgi:hypothetical protein